MKSEDVYQVIGALAKHLAEKKKVMKFSELAQKLSDFYDEGFCDGRAVAMRVKNAYFHFAGDGDMQEAIAKAFVNEQGEYAYEV